MDEIKQKINKLKPVIRIRKVAFEQNRSDLMALISEKKALQRNLQLKQKAYLESVDDLNIIRASKNRIGLASLEKGVDYAKELWVEQYKKISQIDVQIERKIALVAKSQKHLQIAEELGNRYLEEMRRWQVKKQQDHFDNVALDQFHKKG